MPSGSARVSHHVDRLRVAAVGDEEGVSPVPSPLTSQGAASSPRRPPSPRRAARRWRPAARSDRITIVWKLSSASSRPWAISAWYGVYCVYQPGFSRMLRWITGGVMCRSSPSRCSERKTWFFAAIAASSREQLVLGAAGRQVERLRAAGWRQGRCGRSARRDSAPRAPRASPRCPGCPGRDGDRRSGQGGGSAASFGLLFAGAQDNGKWTYLLESPA